MIICDKFVQLYGTNHLLQKIRLFNKYKLLVSNQWLIVSFDTYYNGSKKFQFVKVNRKLKNHMV